MLDGLAARHPFVAAELEALKLEAGEIERRRAEAERKKSRGERKRAEAERQKLEAEAARLKSEREAARKKLEAEVERLKREGEAERLKFEAEAARLKGEAEAERQKRQAEAERLKREAENARQQREAEADRRRREAEADRLKREADATLEQRSIRPASNDEPNVSACARATTRRATGGIRNPGLPSGADPTRVYRPPPRPAAASHRRSSGGSGQGASKGLALGAIALVAVIVVALGIIIVMKWSAGGGPDGPIATVSDQTASRRRLPNAQGPVAAGRACPARKTRRLNAADPRSTQSQRSRRQGCSRAWRLRRRHLVGRSGPGPRPAQSRSSRSACESRRIEEPWHGPARPERPGEPAEAHGTAARRKPSGRAANASQLRQRSAECPLSEDAGASARARDLTDRYTRAKSALDGGAFSTAIPLLDQLQRDEPNYRDVPALLVRAREGLGNAAKQALDTGAKLESAGDLAGAVQQYERGRQIDPSVAPVADPSINRVRARMKTEGADAFGRGRQDDALDRIEQAIAQYRAGGPLSARR